jgi:DNA-binding transcriptional LysR family regulator
MVALPERHPLAGAGSVLWQDLAGETFIVASRGSGPEVRATVQSLLPDGHTARFAAHDVGREGMFNLVGAGFGVAVLAESASGASYPSVVFRPGRAGSGRLSRGGAAGGGCNCGAPGMAARDAAQVIMECDAFAPAPAEPPRPGPLSMR